MGITALHPRPGVASQIRRIAIVAVALMAMLAAAAPAVAAPTSYSEKVIFAGATWYTEEGNTWSDLSIRVSYLSTYSSTTGRAHFKDPGLTLFYTHEALDPETNLVTRTEYEGFVGGDSTATFDFDANFESASAEMTVPLFGYQCIEAGPAGIVEPECHDLDPATVQVTLQWTGYGEIITTKDKNAVTDIPGFGFHSRVSIQQRNATVTGTVAGDGLVLADGPGTGAILLKGSDSEDTVTK